MKKIIIIVFILSLSSQLMSQNKEPENRNNLVSFSVTRLFLSNMSFSYERMINNSGIMLAGGVTLKDNNEESETGLNLELQYRLYPKLMREKTFQGMYIAPYFLFKYLDEENNYYCYDFIDCIDYSKNDIYRSYGFGVVFGMKVAIAQRLVFTYELGGGLKYSDGPVKSGQYNIFHPGYTGIIPRADISLGYFF